MIRHLFLLLASLCVVVFCDHLILGDTANKQLLHHTVAQYHAIPFLTREKDVFYSSAESQKVINAIMAYDNLHSKSSAVVTAGGVNFTYVNLRFTSERGVGLDYDIGIYS